MLLSKFRCFSSQLPPARNLLTTNVQRNFSFLALAKNMDKRKKFLNKVQDYNRKLSVDVLPFHKKTYENMRYHKKKTIFLFIVLGLMGYYDTYSKILRKIRTMEPFRLKLRRWILGEERFIPDSIKETWIAEEGFRLKPETITVLSELFTKADKEFAYGVDKKFLKKVYVKAGGIETKKDKEDFYNEGPYRRKLNQRVCGVSLKLFLLMFERMWRKLQKKDPTLTEEAFLGRVIEAWTESKNKALQWEQKILTIRPELRKAGSVAEDDKQRVLWDKVKENPMVPFEEIERTLADNGFYGMSLKDKLLVLQYQVMNFEVTRGYYASKLEKEVIPAKTMKLERKVKELDEKILRYKELLSTHRAQYKEIFQKPKEPETAENAEGNTDEKSKEGESTS